MAKNSKSDVAKKAAVIGGAILGAGGAAFGANAIYNHVTSDDDNKDEQDPQPEDPQVEVDPEMEVEEDVEVEYDEPVEAGAGNGAHHAPAVVDPIVEAEDINDVALVIEPEEDDVVLVNPQGEVAVEPEIEIEDINILVVEAEEEDINVDDIVDGIIVNDSSTELSYNPTGEGPAFGADADYVSDDLV